MRIRQLLLVSLACLSWAPAIALAQDPGEPNPSDSEAFADAVLDCLLASDTDHSKLSFIEQVTECEEKLERSPEESEEAAPATPPAIDDRQ